jgi:signal transduction histidine kinase
VRTALSRTLPPDIAAIARIDAVETILEVVCRTTGMGFSAVARVTDDQWIACAVRDEIQFGLEAGGELQVETTICDDIRKSGTLVVIEHVTEDEEFCAHPTPKLYGFESYISMPIFRSDGRFFGTLCAIDPRPARLRTPEILGMFKLFADLIAFHLDALDRLVEGETALRDERETAELREQFIAILGHDLRNPLASISAGASTLLHMPIDDKSARIATRIQRSVERMSGLISDVMDFARGRLGGGFALARRERVRLHAALEQVIAELRSAWPDRVIESELALQTPVTCDDARVAQLFSNLLANALSHGDPGAPVRVYARSGHDGFELTVVNHGEAIPPETLGHLFQPFSRASVRPDQEGLGLGLYIASEIARAHDGSLECLSTAEETRFTFRMAACQA